MSRIITQELVYNYICKHPGTTPQEIIKELKVEESGVKKRLSSLLLKNKVDRKIERLYRLDSIKYFPKSKSA